ncbi:MAG: flippase-like domain-containing protein [Thermoleophilia bacterium]|nr:flippase-like domain-containing protein [Thermoleophilia bacterium]
MPPAPAPDEEIRFGEGDGEPSVIPVAQYRFGLPRVVVIHSPAAPPTVPRGFRIPVKTLVFLAAAAVGLYFVWPQLVGFFDAVPGLRTIEWYWFVLMAALQAASFACYWAVMRVTVHERRWSVLALTQLTSNAFGRIVPGGAASVGSLGYQMLVAAGTPKGRAVTGLTAATLLSTATLVVLPVFSLPAILAGAPVGRSLVRALEIGVAAAALIIVGGAVILFTDRLLLWLGSVAHRVLDRVRPAGAPRHDLPARLIEERDLIKRSLGDKWWLALSATTGKWLLDFASLLAALAAVGATARPSLVLLAFVVAGVLGTIPLTPGGVGFVEVGLAATLGLAGVGAAEATAAVLAYRLVSFWLPIPVGLVAGAVFTRRYGGRRRARSLAAESG